MKYEIRLIRAMRRAGESMCGPLLPVGFEVWWSGIVAHPGGWIEMSVLGLCKHDVDKPARS